MSLIQSTVHSTTAQFVCRNIRPQILNWLVQYKVAHFIFGWPPWKKQQHAAHLHRTTRHLFHHPLAISSPFKWLFHLCYLLLINHTQELESISKPTIVFFFQALHIYMYPPTPPLMVYSLQSIKKCFSTKHWKWMTLCTV